MSTSTFRYRPISPPSTVLALSLLPLGLHSFTVPPRGALFPHNVFPVPPPSSHQTYPTHITTLPGCPCLGTPDVVGLPRRDTLWVRPLPDSKVHLRRPSFKVFQSPTFYSPLYRFGPTENLTRLSERPLIRLPYSERPVLDGGRCKTLLFHRVTFDPFDRSVLFGGRDSRPSRISKTTKPLGLLLEVFLLSDLPLWSSSLPSRRWTPLQEEVLKRPDQWTRTSPSRPSTVDNTSF